MCWASEVWDAAPLEGNTIKKKKMLLDVEQRSQVASGGPTYRSNVWRKNREKRKGHSGWRAFTPPGFQLNAMTLGWKPPEGAVLVAAKV